MDLLKQKLSLTLVLAPPDGDCFFSAYPMDLLYDLITWKHSLTLAGLENHAELTVEAVAAKLRHVFVQELLVERRVRYEAFVNHTNLDYEERL